MRIRNRRALRLYQARDLHVRLSRIDINIHFDVTEEDGSVTQWLMPTAAPNVAGRNGMTPDTISPGDRAIVTGWPARDRTNRLRALTIDLEDGRSFPLTPQRTGMGLGMGAQ